MKSFVSKKLLMVLAVSALGAVGCNNNDVNNTSSSSDEVLKFVAVTSTEWDAQVSVGEHAYTLVLTLNKDNSLKLKGTCVGAAQKSQGGPNGGGGFPGGEGGGFPGGENQGGQPGGQEGGFQVGQPQGRVRKANENESSSTEEESTSIDYSSFDFEKSGSWIEETGYGYVLTIDSKTIHVDFNKEEGRHEFFYTVETNEGKAEYTKFQAKDQDYRSKLAKDYTTWDIRDSKYIFTGEVKGNNNSVALGYLYFHNDGSVVNNTASGADRKVSDAGTWKEENKEITLTYNGQDLIADKSINADNPGYRLTVDGTSYLCSTNGKDFYSMSNQDFDGASKYLFTSSESEEVISLTEDGKAFIYDSSNVSKVGSYTFTNEVFHITFDQKTVDVSKNADGVYEYSMTTSVKDGPFTKEKTVVFTLEI